MRIMPATAKKEDRCRQSVRFQSEMWEAIDLLRARRPGVVSRNTWIAEAILEKLARDQDTEAPPTPAGGSHV
jgi:hypothetical protein